MPPVTFDAPAIVFFAPPTAPLTWLPPGYFFAPIGTPLPPLAPLVVGLLFAGVELERLIAGLRAVDGRALAEGL